MTTLGWAPALPAHWQTVPLNFVAKMGTGHTPDRSKPEYWEDCTIPWITLTDASHHADSLAPIEDTYQYISEAGMQNSAAVLHPADTVILSRTASVGHSARVGRPMATTQDFAAWSCSSQLDSKYLLLVLRAMKPEWERLAFGSTHRTIYMPDLESLQIPLPPIEEQRRISDFVDTAVSEIDAIIDGRTRQLGRLNEFELAWIGREIAGSGEPRRRETGWKWLPSVPASWKVGPVYAYFDIELGKMLNAARAAGDRSRKYLRNANIHWYKIDSGDMSAMEFGPDERQRYGVRAGDLLVCEGGAGVAEAAVWDGRIDECYYQKSLHRVRARKDVPVEWLMYWLKYAKAAGVFSADGNLATIPHLTGEQLAEYKIPIPPDGLERVRRLGSRISLIEDAKVAIQAAKTLLVERRQALITAAVTGQIDLTTARGIEV